MKCPHCNAENAAEARVCEACGKDLTAPAPAASTASQAPATAPQAKKLLISVAAGFAALLLLIIIIAVACSGGGKGDYVRYEQYFTLQENADDQYVFLLGNKILDKKLDKVENDDMKGAFSIDRSKVAIIYDGTLYVIKGNDLVKVADEVIGFKMSLWGDSIVYLTAGDEEGDTMTHYTVSNGKSKKIVSDVQIGQYIISPDGKSVAYTLLVADEEEDTVKKELYYFAGSDSVKISNADVSLKAVSNGGNYIYATLVNDEGKTVLYSYDKKGEERKKIAAISNDYNTLTFNLDNTQVLYYVTDSDGDTKTYVSTKAGEPQKISSTQITLLVPQYCATTVAGGTRTAPVKSFFDKVYTGTDSSGNRSAYYINKNSDKSMKLVSNISSYRLDITGEYLYYIPGSGSNSGTLMCLRIDDGDNAKDQAIYLADDVTSYVFTNDRSKVYYVCDKTLYAIDGKGGKPKTISNDDVDSQLVVTDKDIVYYNCGDALYASKGGKKGTKVLDDIDGFTGAITCVYAIGDDSFYIATGTGKAKKLFDI